MARRRLLLALGVALAVLVAAVAVWWLAPPRPGVTAANCARIKKGMREAEVEAILGGPPGCYVRGRLGGEFPVPAGEGPAFWHDGSLGGQVDVWYAADGTVERAEFTPLDGPFSVQRLLSRLRRLLP